MIKFLESENDKTFRYIETGLTGKINEEILDSVLGQMSDGIWENSPSMEKYWRFVNIEEDNGELLIVVDAESGKYDNYSRRGFTENGFYNMSPSDIKKFFAHKIKKIVYEEIGNTQWTRDNNTHLDYLSYYEDVQVKDAYKAYETLLGRKIEGKYDDRREPIDIEIKIWLDKVIGDKGWVFQSEIELQNSPFKKAVKDDETFNDFIKKAGYSIFDSNDLLQYVKPSQRTKFNDTIGKNGFIVSKLSKVQIMNAISNKMI